MVDLVSFFFGVCVQLENFNFLKFIDFQSLTNIGRVLAMYILRKQKNVCLMSSENHIHKIELYRCIEYVCIHLGTYYSYLISSHKLLHDSLFDPPP